MPINQEMLKTAQQVFTKAAVSPEYIAPLAGAALGGGVGALAGGKNKMRNALLGALAGGGAGAATEYFAPGVGLGLKYLTQDKITDPAYRGILSAMGGTPSIKTEVGNVAGRLGRIPESIQYGARRQSDLPGLQFLMGANKSGSVKQSADEWQRVDLAKNPINWSRMLPKADASAKNWGPMQQGRPAAGAPPMAPVNAPPMAPVNAPPMQQVKRAFGAKYAAGLDLSGLQKYLPGAGVGAGAGALVGGLGGLMFPGKRRGRLGGALRGALAGAGLGGLAGGAAGGGAFGQGAQTAMADVYKRLGEFYTDKFNPKSRLAMRPQTPEEFAAAAGEEYTGGPTPASETDNTVALNKAEHRRATLARHPSAGGDYAMAQALSRPPQAPPTPNAPMSQDLLDAYGEEPTGQ